MSSQIIDFSTLAQPDVQSRAAVAFLAIPGPELRVVSRSAILISILSALGSLVAGLFCASKYQSHTSEDEAFRSPTSDYAVRPLPALPITYSLLILPVQENYRKNLLGHQFQRRMYYAIVLSLPAVLLLWSMISFTVAIVAFNFSGSRIISHASQAVVSLWAVILIMSAFVVLGVEFAWSSSGRSGFRRLLPATPPQSKGYRLKSVRFT